MCVAYRVLLFVGGCVVRAGSDEYRSVCKDVHKRAASRLLHVCQLHGGIYVKFGQYLASMNHVLPKEYTDTLKVLQDRNPFIPVEKIEQTILEEFGKTAQEMYRHFDREPIAAASLAQVHHAVTHSGQEVAVKVQYPHLQKQVRSDVKGMRFLAALVGRVFPDYQYSWIMPDFEESILQELDFVQEAVNSERVRRMYEHRSDIYVPQVVWDATSTRVLTQEFIHGCKVTDVDKIEAMGLSPQKIASTITSFFGEMVYVHGFVHCDPHPGNLLVRIKPVASQQHERQANQPLEHQVIILDHGMYRRLQSGFRSAYSELWKAFMTMDIELGKKAAVKLGIPADHYEDIALFFRPASDRAPSKRTAEKAREIRRKYEDKTMRDVNNFLESLPRDLLFVFRCQNLVRSLSISLGGTVVDRTNSLGDSALKGLALNEMLCKVDYHAIRELETDDIPLMSDRKKPPPLPPVEDYEVVDPSQVNPAPFELSVIALREFLQASPVSRWD
jgi:aarF domain-containing kinase